MSLGQDDGKISGLHQRKANGPWGLLPHAQVAILHIATVLDAGMCGAAGEGQLRQHRPSSPWRFSPPEFFKEGVELPPTVMEAYTKKMSMWGFFLARLRTSPNSPFTKIVMLHIDQARNRFTLKPAAAQSLKLLHLQPEPLKPIAGVFPFVPFSFLQGDIFL